MDFIHQKARLCSTNGAQPQLKAFVDEDRPKYIEIPPSAYQTKSLKIEHDNQIGHLFQVNILNVHFSVYVRMYK